ncbi:hypothetical protein BOTCAL_0076g00220 [Botryotinia calthae]|uniref:Uncharacterized protein n=1 Tax=Botryotinia calthae TaxID=38488 RepID=A0A4Y8DAN9_9HELO|nr:hypothetical protein BOTCAL_0076g00220 [Botryotinia calthae]
MENKTSTPSTVERQYGRLRGSNRNYGDDLEACISGQMRPGTSSSTDAYSSTACPDSRGPDFRLPHPNISSQAQFYRRSYPDILAGSENGIVRHDAHAVYSSAKLPGFEQNTQQSRQYSTPSPIAQDTGAISRGVATRVKSSSRPSNPSSRTRSSSSSIRLSSSGSRASNRENYRRGAQNIGVGYEEFISIRLFFF